MVPGTVNRAIYMRLLCMPEYVGKCCIYIELNLFFFCFMLVFVINLVMSKGDV